MTWSLGLRLDWLNGWIPVALLGLTDVIIFALFPKDVDKRLFDRSGWPRRTVYFTLVSKLFALACLSFLSFSPIKFNGFLFIVSTIFVLLGLLGVLIALLNFKNAPPDQPVITGLYQISRHPQIVTSSLVILGACLMVGSWIALILLLLARIFGHASLIAEEQICLEIYGQPYRQYLEKVPRYLFFF